MTQTSRKRRGIGRRQVLSWVDVALVLGCAVLWRLLGFARAADGDVSVAFFGIFIAIFEAVADFFHAFGGVTLAVLAHAFTILRTGVIALARGVKDALWEVGHTIAHPIRALQQLNDIAFRPLVRWVKQKWDTFEAWLKGKLKPAFDFIARVRDEIKSIYQHFVRPVLEALDIAHAILRTLGDLGLQWARALDRWVVEAESAITENFLRVTGWINDIYDVLTAVVTPDRLFQRFPFIRTLERDAGYMVRLWWNAQVEANAHPTAGLRTATKLRTADPSSYGPELGAFIVDGSGEFSEAANAVAAEWRKAAGFDPSAMNA
jgi:hypothetical protein